MFNSNLMFESKIKININFPSLLSLRFIFRLPLQRDQKIKRTCTKRQKITSSETRYYQNKYKVEKKN